MCSTCPTESSLGPVRLPLNYLLPQCLDAVATPAKRARWFPKRGCSKKNPRHSNPILEVILLQIEGCGSSWVSSQLVIIMAKGSAPDAASTPKTSTPALKKSSSNTQSTKNQKTLHGFFQKTPSTSSASPAFPERPYTAPRSNGTLQKRISARTSSSQLTPAPSSDGPEEGDAVGQTKSEESFVPRRGLPSPVSPANGELDGQTDGATEELTAFGTPSRKASVHAKQSRTILT